MWCVLAVLLVASPPPARSERIRVTTAVAFTEECKTSSNDRRCVGAKPSFGNPGVDMVGSSCSVWLCASNTWRCHHRMIATEEASSVDAGNKSKLL